MNKKLNAVRKIDIARAFRLTGAFYQIAAHRPLIYFTGPSCSSDPLNIK